MDFKQVFDQMKKHEQRKPQVLGVKYETDKIGDSVRVYYMVCQQCGQEMATNRKDKLYHPRCKSEAFRERKALIEQVKTFVCLVVIMICLAVDHHTKKCKQ
jgi:predicted Zn-ribbon and HTH transcriptional regulator